MRLGKKNEFQKNANLKLKTGTNEPNCTSDFICMVTLLHIALKPTA